MIHGCINGTLDDSKYSSDVPTIGLYIAAGSFVLLLFLVLDILSAFRLRRSWIPCQLLSLNSVTLTLLAICVKLPLDLTTPMPSVQDQLSKLTGNALLGTAMMFFSPSVGDNGGSERVTNLSALSILVFTVSMNIWFQIHTGVIHHFIPEHVVIVVATCFLVGYFWGISSTIAFEKKMSHEDNKKLFTNGEGSMLSRLKFCYLHDFMANPQINTSATSKLTESGVIIFCLVYFFCLIEAMVRSLAFKDIKFCGGVSDYKGSMWIIVAIQVLIVIVGCFAEFIRLMLAKGMPDGVHYFRLETYLISIHDFLEAPVESSCWNKWTQFLSNFSCHQRRDEEAVLEEFKPLIESGFDERVLRKALNEMSRLTEAVPLVNLPPFLARTNPSPDLRSLHLDVIGQVYPDQQGIQVSSLSMALLVKIATFCIPAYVHVDGPKSLEKVLNDVCNVIYFIEARTNYARRETRQKTKLAKAVLLGNGFDTDDYNSKISMYKNREESYTGFARASLIIKHLKDAIGSGDYMSREVASITELISRRDHRSIEDLYLHIEQIFVDMLHLFLAQIPIVIMKEVMECPAEEFEEKVRSSLKLLRNIAPVEDHVQWLFPSGCNNLSSLITSHLSENV